MDFIRIMTRARAYLLVAAIAATGCAASKGEVRRAEKSGYDTEFAKVYSEALAAVRSLYPALSENATAGIIKTSWHEVRINQKAGDPPKSNQRLRQGGLFEATSQLGSLYFVRFTVRVVGGDPWRVTVVGQASEWDPQFSAPSELKGGDEPSWLQGRVNALRVKIHDRLKRYAVELPETARTPALPGDVDPPAPVDVARFSGLPRGAAQVVARTLAASQSRDFDALGADMSEDFVWSLGAAPGSRTAVVMWQADSSLLGHMTQAIEAGCRADRDGARVTCPPQYTEQPGYLGYRVGYQRGSDGSWKMTFFVSGN